MNKSLLIMAKKMNACSELLTRKSTLIAAGFALSLACINGNPVQAATFRYTIAQAETLYKEDKTIFNGIEYDGSFVKLIGIDFALTIFWNFCGVGILPAQIMQLKYSLA